jgi:TetR/AcrR family transcriptional regulator, transcriptional repressor for nem operon
MYSLNKYQLVCIFRKLTTLKSVISEALKPSSSFKPQPRAVLTRTSLLDAALKVIRTKGYNATSVDDICTTAGVTKGSFFHHFASKEELAIEATRYWNEIAGALFSSAPYQQIADPRERILAYIDFRAQIVQGDLADVTCLLGTMVQETYDSHPAIRAACREGIEGHARTLIPTIEAAKAFYAPQADWSAENLALYTQAALQGAFILAKAKSDANIAVQFIAHLRQYVQGLLQAPQETLSASKLATYIDGYVIAVPLANKAAYIRHVQDNILVFKQYGALRVMECWADDVPSGRTNSYGHAVQQEESEAVVFAWIEWPFKAMRDAAWPLILRDPRMSPEQNPMPFDMKRMLRGGFQTIVNG